VEFSELSSMASAKDVEHVKSFLSVAIDRYRPSYGRLTGIFPRTCVFGGTTNQEKFLRDPTGNRRYWVVSMQRNGDRARVMDERDQVWAEAMATLRHAQLWLTDEEEAQARVDEVRYLYDGGLMEAIQGWLDEPVPEHYLRPGVHDFASGTTLRQAVCIKEIWEECLGGKMKDISPSQRANIMNAMQAIPGWSSKTENVWHGKWGHVKAYTRIVDAFT
jgi:predicted P-loop ATPase